MPSRWMMLLAIPLSTGCPSSKQTESKKPAPTASCEKRTAALATALAKLNDPPRVSPTMITGRNKLVELQGARYVSRLLPLLALRAKLLTLDGSEVSVGGLLDLLPQEAIDGLGKTWRIAPSIHGETPTRDVLLQVEATTPWRSISALVRGLKAAGASRVGLLVAVEDPSPPVPKSSLTATLLAYERTVEHSVDPSRKATRMDVLSPAQRRIKAFWRRTTKHCPQIKGAFTAVGMIEPAQKARTAGRAFAKALRACGCDAELPAIHATLHLMFHQRPTGVVWFEHGAKGPIVARPAAEPWKRTVEGWLKKAPRAIVHGTFGAR